MSSFSYQTILSSYHAASLLLLLFLLLLLLLLFFTERIKLFALKCFCVLSSLLYLWTFVFYIVALCQSFLRKVTRFNTLEVLFKIAFRLWEARRSNDAKAYHRIISSKSLLGGVNVRTVRKIGMVFCVKLGTSRVLSMMPIKWVRYNVTNKPWNK